MLLIYPLACHSYMPITPGLHATAVSTPAADAATCLRILPTAPAVIILTGGCMFFGDDMPPKKLLGVCVAMFGIVW
jgi:hypothetical protein